MPGDEREQLRIPQVALRDRQGLRTHRGSDVLAPTNRISLGPAADDAPRTGVSTLCAGLIEAGWIEMQSLLWGALLVSDSELAERRETRMSSTWRALQKEIWQYSILPILTELSL